MGELDQMRRLTAGLRELISQVRRRQAENAAEQEQLASAKEALLDIRAATEALCELASIIDDGVFAQAAKSVLCRARRRLIDLLTMDALGRNLHLAVRSLYDECDR